MPRRLPANASATKKRLATFLKQRLKLPDVVLIILFSVRPWAWALLVAWLVGARLASFIEVGLLVTLATGKHLSFPFMQLPWLNGPCLAC